MFLPNNDAAAAAELAWWTNVSAGGESCGDRITAWVDVGMHISRITAATAVAPIARLFLMLGCSVMITDNR